MNINPKELQKFHDLWAPMIAALPAVINAAEHAAELTNHVAILQGQRDAAVQHRKDAEATIASSNAAAAAELKKLADEKAALSKDLKEHAKDCKAKAAAAEALLAGKLEELAAKGAEAAKAAEALTQDLLDRKAAADKDYAEHLQSKAAELAEVEAKLAAAQSSLDRLRAKLG